MSHQQNNTHFPLSRASDELSHAEDELSHANDELSHAYDPLVSAEARFKELLESSDVKISNPIHIYDELATLRDISSKLKFQYLEQDTRDKFLRLILLKHDFDVSQDDIDQITLGNVEAKAALKDIKKRVNETIRDSEAVSNDVILVHEQCEIKKTQIDETAEELALLQQELDLFLEDSSNEDCRTLYDAFALMKKDEIVFERSMDIAKDAIVLVELAVEKSKANVVTAQRELETVLEARKEIEAQLIKLDNRLREAEKLQGAKAQNHDQAHAQAILETNTVLRRFIGTDFSLDTSNGIFKLDIKDVSIILDSQLKIVRALEGVSQNAIQLINCSDKDRFWRLLRLLCSLVYQG